MGVRGPQGPRGATGPRVSDKASFDILQDLQIITFDFIFHKETSMMQPWNYFGLVSDATTAHCRPSSSGFKAFLDVDKLQYESVNWYFL